MLHLIATAKQMRLALRLAADEASSTAARETALEATGKFEKELEEAKKLLWRQQSSMKII